MCADYTMFDATSVYPAFRTKAFQTEPYARHDAISSLGVHEHLLARYAVYRSTLSLGTQQKSRRYFSLRRPACSIEAARKCNQPWHVRRDGFPRAAWAAAAMGGASAPRRPSNARGEGRFPVLFVAAARPHHVSDALLVNHCHVALLRRWTSQPEACHMATKRRRFGGRAHPVSRVAWTGTRQNVSRHLRQYGQAVADSRVRQGARWRRWRRR